MAKGRKMDIKIIVATHKKYRMPESDMYLPIQVGAEGKEDIGYERDDKGDNISSKNSTYSELTGMYYGWKNIDTEYIGLVHYRRYFATLERRRSKDPFQNILTINDAKKCLREADIIVPSKRRYYIESLYSHYAHTLDGRHLRVAYKLIAKHYPEYIASCNRVYHRTWGYMFNMFISRKEIWDSYCQWLFDILRMMEPNIDLSQSSDFEARVYGRVSEILFNVWLDYNMRKGLTIKEVRCVHMEPVNWINKGTSFLKAKFIGKKYKESF